MKNKITKTSLQQALSSYKASGKLRLIENMCIDVNPKHSCERIYSSFIKRLEAYKRHDNGYKEPPAPNNIPMEKIWEYISLESNKSYNHISLRDSVIRERLQGSFLGSSSGWRSPFVKLEAPDIHSANIIAMGGIDFDTMEHFGALRKNLYNFNVSLNSDDTSLLDPNKVLFYYPLYPKERRYLELLKFHVIPNYASEEMIEFAHRYVLPKIISNESVSFFCFSASCRELLMIENVCYQQLQQFGFDVEERRRIMSSVSAILVGYAFDWSSSPDYGFKKVILHSLEDFGIMRTKFNRELIYGASCLVSGVNIIQKTEDGSEVAIIFGQGVVPTELNDKINWNGHSLTHYIHSYNQLILKVESEKEISFT